MDNLHIELMEAAKKEHEKAKDADKYFAWWQEEKKRANALEQENITLKASITELEELLQDCCENTRS